ncbi:hypothetical protein B0T18DRAFT_399077 [Schizothecium vesticola]|uniref:Glucan 1, 4-alpha-glucosidase n=1 Tax=Schizothecium vesticola TaxID=314040 RepID=A0AA40KCY3_9PEZI|nr:hypothetical protein B0T18DRAFT_399077 [Schizothecium vesticola]
MDDPWGSPWTTTDTDRDIKPPSPAKSTRSDLEPPPRAFFAISNAPKIPTALGKSPWADDDDGFGDWAAPGTPAPAQSAWGGGWTAPSPRLATPSRDPDFGSASPIAWPGNIALPKPASSVNLRPPSPDPWSAEFPPPIDESSTPRLVVEPPLPDDPKSNAFGGEENRHNSTWTAEPTTRTQTEVSKPESWPRTELRPEQSVSSSDGPNATSIEQNRPGQSSVDAAEQDHELPPSSSSGGDSDGEDGRPDSPITSIDEDARIRQPVARKVSGKIQVLVERFDGLARAQSEEPPVVRRQQSRATLGADAETTKGFEELRVSDESALQGPSAGRASTPRALEPTTSRPSSPAISPPRPPGDVAATSGRGFPDHAPPSFDVNLKLVDELFGQSMTQPCRPGLGLTADVSDRILSDSFIEISERKTWYRVSRIGSSRRHNSGDDENYRLVTWPTSTVRLDTLKVVRRWMEEDSISGRVTLGGGVSKTQKNMFGWDSSAEPMALDAALAKRRGAQRPSSVQTLNDVPGRIFGSLRSPIHRPSSVAIPSVASFSWSSNSPVTPHHTQSPSTIPVPPDARTPQPDTPLPTKPLTHSLPLPVATPPSQILAGNDDGDGDDDDDDWGEMISSPPSTNAPLTGLQNFELALPAASQAILAPAAPILSSLPTTATSTLQEELLVHPSEPIQDAVLLAAESSKPIVLPPMPTAAADPWEMVDLSVFKVQPTPLADIPSLERATDRPAPIVEEPTEYSHHALLTSSMAATKLGSDVPPSSNDLAVEQDFTPTTPLELNPPLPLPQSEDQGDRAGFQTPEPDNAVRQIIDNLPDLSYMLR